MNDLVRYLGSRGIALSASQFSDLVREAFEGVAGTDLYAEPETELTVGDLALLREGGFESGHAPRAGKDPVLRGALEFGALVASALSTQQAARLLDVNTSRIRQRLCGPQPTLYGVKWRREWRLPRFQFAGKAELPGLADVIPRLDAGLHPIALARWFLSPNPDLRAGSGEGEPVSPRDWLLAGRPPAEVARLADDV